MDSHHDHHRHDDDHDHGLQTLPVGPVAQSVTIGFLAIYTAVLVLALFWLASNLRQIAPDSQAVVLRYGRVVRTQTAGLLLALPRPIEQVVLLPGPDRQLSQAVQPLAGSDGLGDAPPDASGGAVPAGAAPYLTGDGNVVLLNAELIYRIDDPASYVLAKDHVAPALDRLFRAAAVHAAAARELNDFLVAHPTAPEGPAASVTALRGAVLDSLLADINGRLQALAAGGRALGVVVERIDMTAWLPPEAKVAFDAVLTATQVAEQGVAGARTEAERRQQAAARERDRLARDAQATAVETVTNAQVATAPIRAVESRQTPQTRDTLLLQAYRASMADVLRRVGKVTLVDPRDGSRLILSGESQ